MAFEHEQKVALRILEGIEQGSRSASDSFSLLEDADPTLVYFIFTWLRERYPDFEIIWFGHIGDGNVHLNILKPENLAREEFFARCAEVSDAIFETVRLYGGSVSAEHGVGLLKKPFLGYSREAAEIAYMKALKQVFDPRGILNPGKIFD